MRPGAEQVLREAASQLEKDVIPCIDQAYSAVTAQLTAFIISAVADQWDGAAAWRHEENQALRALFRGALAVTRDEALRDALEAAAGAPPCGLRISALDAENDRLRALLGRLQADVENLRGEAAATLNRQIWDELAAGAARRAYVTQPV